MTLAEAAPPPARLASWNFCFLGVSVAGDSMHDEFVLLHFGHLCTLALCVRTTFLVNINFATPDSNPRLQNLKLVQV